MVYFITALALVVLVIWAFVQTKENPATSGNTTHDAHRKNSPLVDHTANEKRSSHPQQEREQMSYTKWYSGKSTVGQLFKLKRVDPFDPPIIVYYKSDRFADLFGRGRDCSYFPGYGKIYNRKFRIWAQEFNKKEPLHTQEYFDIGTDHRAPFFVEELTSGHDIYNELMKTGGFIRLFNCRVNKSRLTWYAGLETIEFVGITTAADPVK